MKLNRFLAAGLLSLLLVTSTVAAPIDDAPAVPILGLIKEAVKKAIKAIDLRIQRLQNKTIWLQNAQKEIENTLSRLKFDEISGWVEKQRDLFKDYYDELMKVKSAISYYQRIREVTEKQIRLVDEYQRIWPLLRVDSHFTDDELDYMQKTYSGILAESLSGMDQIFMILESFTTQMSDAQRLELINNAADSIDATYDDLMRFNRQNILLTLQRAKTETDVKKVRQLYGLPQ